jgi:hypothetical protein
VVDAQTRPLADSSWILERLDDPNGTIDPTPSGELVLTFGFTTVTDHNGNSAMIRIEGETIRFRGWHNDLVGHFNPTRPKRPTRDQVIFLFSVLAGRTDWTRTEQQLVITKPGVGSASFTLKSASA